MSDSCTNPIWSITPINALFSRIITSFQFLETERRLGGMALRAALAYPFVLSMMYCSTEVVKNRCKYSIGVTLRGRPMFTPGDAEKVKEVGGRGSASIVLHKFCGNLLCYIY